MSKRVSGIFKGDKVIWMVFFFLCIISAIEVFSALSSLTFKTGDYVSPMIKHIGLLLLGVFFMIVTLNIPCRYFKLATPFLIIGCFIALVWVHFFGQSINGAGRWMSILGIKFQPSEIAKGTMMLATAQILSAMQTDHGADRHAFFYILTIWAILVPLIFLENLSTAVLLSMTVFFMMIIGRVPAKQLLRTVGFIAVVIAISISLVFAIGDDRNADNGNKAYTEMVARNGKVVEKKQQKSMFPRADTWKARIKKFGNNEYVPPEKVDLDKDAQTSYANIAIASSNFIGKGPGNSEERDFLPQAYSDYIYAIIIEETGLLGAFFRGDALRDTSLSRGYHSQPMREQLPGVSRYGVRAYDSHTSVVQHVRGSGARASDGATSATDKQGRNVNGNQLRIHRNDTQREPHSKEKQGRCREEHHSSGNDFTNGRPNGRQYRAEII